MKTNRLLNFFKKLMQIKLNSLVLILAGTMVVYAAAKNADGLWTWSGGDTISSSQMNENFQTLMNRIKDLEKAQVPTKAIMAFYSACPANWVAADGSNGTPDLRGQFVRGLNDFGNGARGDGKQDPDGEGRTLGSWQEDELKSHTHGEHYLYHNGKYTSGSDYGYADNRNTGTKALFNNVGGNETRSKNIGLIYCMKQ